MNELDTLKELLKQGDTTSLQNCGPQTVPQILLLAQDVDTSVSQRARSVLGSLLQAESRNALILAAVFRPDRIALEICQATGVVASEQRLQLLFLAVAGQWSQLEQEDLTDRVVPVLSKELPALPAESRTALLQGIVAHAGKHRVSLLAGLLENCPCAATRESAALEIANTGNQSLFCELCIFWRDTRSPALRELISKHRLIPESPEDAHVLCSLLCNDVEKIVRPEPETVRALCEACTDVDPDIRATARTVLGKATDAAALEEICWLLSSRDGSKVLPVFKEMNFRPLELRARSLYFLLLEDWQGYEKIDQDCQYLSEIYKAATDERKELLRTKLAKAGKPQWLQIAIGGRRRLRLGEISAAEWRLVVGALKRDEAWNEMWILSQVAPLPVSVQLFRQLRTVGWLPENHMDRQGFQQLAELAILCDGNGGIIEFPWLTITQSCPHIVLSPDGKVLAGSTARGTIQIWKLPSLEPHLTIKAHTRQINSLAGSNCGQYLVSASDDGTVRLWSTEGGTELARADFPAARPSLLSVSDHGLLAVSLPTKVVLLRVPDLAPVTELELQAPATALSFSPDGEWLGVACTDNEIKMFHIWQKLLGLKLSAHTGRITGMAFTDRYLVSCSRDRTIRRWTRDKTTECTMLSKSPGEFICLSAAAAQELVVAGTVDCKIVTLQAEQGLDLGILEGHTGGLRSLAIIASGTLLASSGQDGRILVWQGVISDTIPVARIERGLIDWCREVSGNNKLSLRRQNWIAFLLEMCSWNSRFDIELSDSPHVVTAGQFDIEIV